MSIILINPPLNLPDVVTWISPASGASFNYTEGNSVNLSLSASSSKEFPITYSATGLPSGLSISGSSITGTITMGATGTFNIVLSALSTPSNTTVTRNISFVVAVAITDQAYTTAGTYSFTVPAGVTSISAVAIGSGGGGAKWASGSGIQTNGGQGGDLRYGTIAVTPGEVLTVVVGAAVSVSGTQSNPQLGNHSSISRGGTVLLRGQGGGYRQVNSQELSVGTGGNGGWGGWADSGSGLSGGGGGAGGYSGNGGWAGTGFGAYSTAQLQAQGFPTSAIRGANGTENYGKFGQNGSGGGGGGGGFGAVGGGGGGVGILGAGSSGTGGRCSFEGTSDLWSPTEVATGGSSGGSGQAAYGDWNVQGPTGRRGNAGGYGGGAGGYLNINSLGGTVSQSGGGAVRIVWGGKSYPSNAV